MYTQRCLEVWPANPLALRLCLTRTLMNVSLIVHQPSYDLSFDVKVVCTEFCGFEKIESFYFLARSNASLHSFLCALRLSFWHFLLQYWTNLHGHRNSFSCTVAQYAQGSPLTGGYPAISFTLSGPTARSKMVLYLSYTDSAETFKLVSILIP